MNKDFIIKVPSEGMPKKNGDFGDLFIEIVVIYPESLTKTQVEGNKFKININFYILILF